MNKKQTNKQTDKQTDKQTSKEPNKQTDKGRKIKTKLKQIQRLSGGCGYNCGPVGGLQMGRHQEEQCGDSGDVEH